MTLNLYDCEQNNTSQNFNIYRLWKSHSHQGTHAYYVHVTLLKAFQVHQSASIIPFTDGKPSPQRTGLDLGHGFFWALLPPHWAHTSLEELGIVHRATVTIEQV